MVHPIWTGRRGFLVGIMAGILASGSATRAAEESPLLRVATFRCDVTPPLGGHPIIWVKPLATIEDPLWAKGIVLEQDNQRYVICAVDWCGLANSTHRLFREKIAAAAGVDVSRVAVQTVHQHTAPYTDGDAQRLLDKAPNPPRYVDFAFLEAVTDRLAQAVRQSLAHFQPVDAVGWGEAKVERVASSRRIITPDGKFHGRMSSTKDPLLRALPEGFIDPVVRTVTLARGGKPIVRLHYYATHPQSFYQDARASADVPGFARDRLEKEEGVFQIYFTGCAGDVAMGKYNDGSPAARAELADRLYAGLAAAAKATRYRPVDRIRWRALPVVLPLPADVESRLAKERALLADPKADPIARVRAACRVAFAARAQQPLEMSGLRVGDVHILHLPGECMVEYQRFAQEIKPGTHVAVAAYGDLGPGYICTEQAFREGGYEPSASHVASTTEPVLKDAIVRLLEGISCCSDRGN